MDALVDGVAVLSGVDTGVADAPFEGFTLINRGGEFAFRRIAVKGSSR